MKNLSTIVSLLGIAAGVAGCQSTDARTDASVPAPAVAVPTPAPAKVGQPAPTGVLRTPDGKPVEVASLYAAKPSILIFYRGGWCPYCNTHLAQMAQIEPELVKLGYQVLAISPDKPESLKSTIDKGGLTYQLLSDSDVSLISAFGLAFRVDDATAEKYRGFGIDLAAASGRDHHVLPVPAVYIVDAQGVIRFAHSEPDYKKRLSADELIAAAQTALAK